MLTTPQLSIVWGKYH